jgi:hypothetical protein
MSVQAIAHKLDELSKHELVQKLARFENKRQAFVKEHGHTVKRILQVSLQSTLAATTGVALGLLELKLPHIPKTKVRFDTVVGGALALANMAGVTEEALPYVQSISDAMTGHGAGRMAEHFAETHGVKRSAA